MNNTQKALINQDVCEQTTPNLGITQSSGLDHHAVYSRQRVDDSVRMVWSARRAPASTRTPPISFAKRQKPMPISFDA